MTILSIKLLNQTIFILISYKYRDYIGNFCYYQKIIIQGFKMFTVSVDKECGCFQKSDFQNNMSFKSKDDALIEAIAMEKHMNQEFCHKHDFTLTEDGQKFSIAMNTKPQQASSGGCCGGGHCS